MGAAFSRNKGSRGKIQLRYRQGRMASWLSQRQMVDPLISVFPQDFVLSADEKPSIQARRRKHRSLPPAPTSPARIEHEYERKGAWVYLAAWDVRRAKIFGRCARRNGIQPFDDLIAEVMDQEPIARPNACF